ncbi:hypothetical protein [Streptomyces sp. NPDC048361]|uniref:hypothetical protein n=1 Tax=Streptomyces sp. NPDC048361 TaxID=3154720 RepID=UPI00342A0197
MPLGLQPGENTLTHHHRTLRSTGETIHDAVTYFSPTATSHVRELRLYQNRVPVGDPDMRLFYEWVDRAGLRPVIQESVSLTRAGECRADDPPRLAARRHIHDQHGRILAITDFGFTSQWTELTFEFIGRPLVPSSIAKSTPAFRHAYP